MTLTIASFAYKNAWYFDMGATNHCCNLCNIFTSYTEFIIFQAIENIGGSINFLDKDTIRLNMQLTYKLIILINLHNVYYIPSLIANLVSSSSLFRKGFYFYSGKYTFHCISNDQEIAYAPIVNKLFALQVAHISIITSFFQDSTFT